MSVKLITAPERGGRTFVIGVSILGIVAGAQLLLALWVVLFGAPHGFLPAARPVYADPTAVNTVRSEAIELPAAIPGQVDAIPLPLPVPPSPAAIPAAAMADPVLPLPAGSELAAAIHDAHRIEAPAANELFEKALKAREEGDTQGALTSLKKADALSPQHPMILAEMATTYQQMGQDKKAAEHWEVVHLMGSKAGAYWDLANMALSGQGLEKTDNQVNSVLQVTRHTAQTVTPQSNESERVVLKIHLKDTGDESVELKGDNMELRVFFFDLVNNTNFERSVAVTNHRWPTQPYDWKGGSEEIIEVDYILPKLNDEEKAILGNRHYFGYVIELYYRDVLQDMVANPRRLARQSQTSPTPQEFPGSPLFPNSPPGAN